MVLDYFFDKNLVFCLEADNQEHLFDQVASLLEEREIVTPILFENLFKPRQRRLTVCMVTDFVSFIYNLKTVF
ncbi:PTS system transporter subunit IIA [Streptococcus pneumoniae]|nr:PTS system transporter subunit IIA [Streptococcus pneumoniae]CJI29176.1 PTS system transporter subunit IIA [Streptococcus pneumoniae]